MFSHWYQQEVISLVPYIFNYAVIADTVTVNVMVQTAADPFTIMQNIKLVRNGRLPKFEAL